MSRIGKSLETEINRLVVARGLKGCDNEERLPMRVSFGSDENVLKLDNGGGCVTQ